MDLVIRDHVAIVQGASKGIGRGIAEALAREGADLIITARTMDDLKQTAAEIGEATGRTVLPEPADTSDPGTNARLVERAREQFGRLDIVVSNSGGPPPGGLLDLDAEKWRAAAELLLVSPVELLKEAMPLLRQSPAPRFFVVTSSSTRQPVPGLTLSNVFRPGVMGLIKTMAQELGATGLRCHCLSPGRIDTDRLAAVFRMQAEKRGVSPEDVKKEALNSIPAGRLGTPKDMGSVAAFLASPAAEYLTGQNWLVDGGLIQAI